MNDATDRFASMFLLQRTGHRKRLVTALLVAALIAVLIYQTQWLSLRPGLFVLLAGQAGAVVALLWRIAQLSRATAMDEQTFAAWIESEVRFIKRLALFETVCQAIGFEALGYALWIATRSLGMALAIGVIYPVTLYFGMTRRRNKIAIGQLIDMREPHNCLGASSTVASSIGPARPRQEADRD